MSRLIVLVLCGILAVGVSRARAGVQGSEAASFGTPEAAVTALVEAVRSGKPADLRAVLGPDADKLIVSGDPVADIQQRTHFLDLYDRAHALTAAPDGHRTLTVGPDAWPLPLPIVAAGATWHFDTKAGAQEIVDRRIGRNEIDAIQTMLAVFDAQNDYADRAAKAGHRHYARHLVSTDTGVHDGLYWEPEGDEPASPLGPLVDAAVAEGYSDHPDDGHHTPYRGYLFRVLTGQGPHAADGARSYLHDGELTTGFALIGCPASYGAGGYMSFIVNQDGIVFQKDLGEQTDAACAAITRFDPDFSWARVEVTNN